MKKCKNCGAEVSDTAILCPVCDGFVDPVDNEKADEIIEKNVSVAQIQNRDSVAPNAYVESVQPEFNKMEDAPINNETEELEELEEPEISDTQEETVVSDIQENQEVQTEPTPEVSEPEPVNQEQNNEIKPQEAEKVQTEVPEPIQTPPPVVPQNQPPVSDNQPQSTAVPENNNYNNPYSADLSPAKKKSKAPVIIIVIIAVVAVLAVLAIFVVVPFVKNMTSSNEVNYIEETTEPASISETVSEELSSDSESESVSETDSTEELSSENESSTEVFDYVNSDNVADNIEENNIDNDSMSYVLVQKVNEKYSVKSSVTYSQESNTYTIKIFSDDFAAKVASVKSSEATADTLSQDITELTSNCVEFRNILFAYGIDANVTCSFLAPDSSEDLLTVSDGEVTYNAAE